MGFSIFGGCSRHSQPLDAKAFSIFSDFAFVGEGSYQPSTGLNGDVNPTVAEHGQVLLSLPKTLDIGRQYIFHHRLPFDVERFALVELPERLRRRGLEITKAPHSSKEMTYLYFGGPIFVIKFKQGDHVGIIFDQLCPKLKDQVKNGWSANDYVMVFLK
jgi:hypothetical protein